METNVQGQTPVMGIQNIIKKQLTMKDFAKFESRIAELVRRGTKFNAISYYR